ncbi:MAG TPA: Ig-like domain-containing protein [Firmicutes bacterium]|nr:Ig-like domain-containing protein [Bacillota bacterium]
MNGSRGPLAIALAVIISGVLSLGWGKSGGGVLASGAPAGRPGPPRVVQVYPSGGMSNVPVDTGIHVIFSEPMDADTLIQSVMVVPSPRLVYPGSWQFLNDNAVMVLVPAGPLEYGKEYTVIIKRGARDRSGEEMDQDYSWTFTTEKKPERHGDVPVNGGFESGDISGWVFGYQNPEAAPAPRHAVVADPGDKEHHYALVMSRDPNPTLSRAWVEQRLDVDLPAYGLIFLSLDVRLGDYTRRVYTDGETYPARVVVGYLDRYGREHTFARSYYYHLPSEGGVNSYAEFQELDVWTTWRYNLSLLNPRPFRLKYIRLECSGWGWNTAFDNVRVVF